MSADPGGKGTLQDGAEVRVVLATFPDERTAADVAAKLVGERLAACVNLVPGARSIYAWQGEVHDDAEVLALIKTAAPSVEACSARLAALHPYDTPECVVLKPNAVSTRYLDWLKSAVGTADEPHGGGTQGGAPER